MREKHFVSNDNNFALEAYHFLCCFILFISRSSESTDQDDTLDRNVFLFLLHIIFFYLAQSNLHFTTLLAYSFLPEKIKITMSFVARSWTTPCANSIEKWFEEIEEKWGGTEWEREREEERREGGEQETSINKEYEAQDDNYKSPIPPLATWPYQWPRKSNDTIPKTKESTNKGEKNTNENVILKLCSRI